MSGLEHQKDEALIERIRSGEEDLVEVLIERYKEMVRQRARTLFLIGGERDDLIQEGMIGLFKAIRDYRGDRGAAFSTFARLCVDRQIATALEHAMRGKNLPLNSYVSLSEQAKTPPYEEGAPGQNPEAILISRENVAGIEEAIEKQLTGLERAVLSRYLSGESYADIGAALGKSPKSVDNALQRIRSKIRACLEDMKGL